MVKLQFYTPHPCLESILEDTREKIESHINNTCLEGTTQHCHHLHLALGRDIIVLMKPSLSPNCCGSEEVKESNFQGMLCEDTSPALQSI